MLEAHISNYEKVLSQFTYWAFSETLKAFDWLNG